MRLHTVSVAPPESRQVPEGDMKKIKAMSWLLDHPDTQAEATVQVRRSHQRATCLEQFVVLGLSIGTESPPVFLASHAATDLPRIVK